MEVPNTKVDEKGIQGGRCDQVTLEMSAAEQRCSMGNWIEDSGVQEDVQARNPKSGVPHIPLVFKAKRGDEINKGVTQERAEAQRSSPETL